MRGAHSGALEPTRGTVARTMTIESPAPGLPTEPGALEAIERARLRALVAVDIATAADLHADDFQLVTPSGRPMDKAAYLGAIAAGRLRYVSWEPGEMAVRVHGSAAVIRYQAVLEVAPAGSRNPPFRAWHIDLYEVRDGRWQVVWSQATAIDEG